MDMILTMEDAMDKKDYKKRIVALGDKKHGYLKKKQDKHDISLCPDRRTEIRERT